MVNNNYINDINITTDNNNSNNRQMMHTLTESCYREPRPPD